MQLKKLKFCIILFFIANPVFSQRLYAPHSALATGNWYKLAVKDPGIYKIDIPFLAAMGINTANIPSAAIRLFGNGGQMLPEANAAYRVDDLQENNIVVVDGGDGIFNGTDYILFYAAGPQQWIGDSATKSFHHVKNLYTDRSFYFLSIGGNGKRIPDQPAAFSAPVIVNSFDEHIFHELDTVNFLKSGKEWFGEEFADAPGKSLTWQFNVTVPGLRLNETLRIFSDCIARSAGNASQFMVTINGSAVQQFSLPPVSMGVTDPFASRLSQQNDFNTTQENLNIRYSFQPASFNAQGWLNSFEILCRRQLSMTGVNQLAFRDWQSVGNTVAGFQVSSANNTTTVWDITDPLHPVRVAGVLQGTDYRFSADCSQLREYIAFHNTGFLQPEALGQVANQDLHQSIAASYLLISHPSLLAQAQRLARFHQEKNQIKTRVVTTDQVYNEFSSGSPDPSAIRDFIKMYFDQYAGTADSLRYALLFGKASFDYKNRVLANTNLVPAYESISSLDPLGTYTSDDFFAFLEDKEDINQSTLINTLDIGIGRVPATNAAEATAFVDKIERYHSKESFGPWRNHLTFIADDEDYNLHLQDAEVISQTAANANKDLLTDKIYLDAYHQEKGAGGSVYPLANAAVNNQILNGTLIWNYTGHGGPGRLAEENVLDQQVVNTWSNADKLPLFITATCDFAPFDNPYQQSLGENILLRPKSGGIALMTTTRLVFAYSNRIMNNNYMRFALEKRPGTGYRSLGETMKEAKNYTYATSGDIANNRKFALLGDPALTVSFPQYQLVIDAVNGQPVQAVPDTIKATDKVTMEGHIADEFGHLLSDFNGVMYPSVLDKMQSITTLANDVTSQPVAFDVQNSYLFNGKASVQQGKFAFTFKVPRDINYSYGKGKISLYASNDQSDANGVFTEFIVGGIGSDAGNDKEGPQIRAFLNDEKFVNGGISNENPILIVKLSDSSGINTSGAGIGHDIVATLDNDNNQYFVLNNYYEAALDNYQQGTARFQLPPLAPGIHHLKVKAWDVVNNSNEVSLDFLVAKDEALEITHVLNYPNPFSSHTSFWFEHNKPGQDLLVRIHIFSASGRLIKTIRQTINTPGNRSVELEWDARDSYGDKVARGVYIYKLLVSSGGKTREVLQKLYIF